MTCTSTMYIPNYDDSGNCNVDFENETLTFDCFFCETKQVHPLTVKFLLGENAIICNECQQTEIKIYSSIKATISEFD